ncbi:MAG: ribosome maturation factor RimP [Piscirickettsiaceae bacterium CG_4_9_14_3_um_filter_43_564]|nr:ribosome maturation factor RimP [Thiomicrospira sp.]OIP94305.1 MAG: ribosome maturation factor RimP [Thiomicrospira sp. CG2_30_44_34]PIQ02548.1 MAG: ribosome maturation factor RimP [Piscirickettsiaceae bacterium CG18_big_fil_WC_8_21_14_2_50_44_103]PIU39025.1 MAG: ribosome maturation factor RimP [Piscirickettsiaceae bacterium CG07_land_8_20_14_0_80_44_28]PIW58165.1 MAG: ribosome maturation factor RimP [Piscirickettsiaceae bacterium CG12_big_fil_rev_8_21_14_0_65_44_934]PIW78176.1 MAG: ribosom
MTLEEKIAQLVRPTVESLGFELWGCEYIPAGKHSTLRLFIESDAGVTVDDCGRVSRQISALMDVEDPIASAYLLEVSSPGMDRLLFTPEQFKAYEGEMVQVRTSSPVMGRKRFKGVMSQVSEKDIVVEVDGEAYELAFDLIDKANLVPQF